MADELLIALRRYTARTGDLQCDFVHVKKGKRCWLRAAPGCRRCKTHLDLAEGDRVQCPLDPSHTVERIHLERHLSTACPSLRDSQFLGSQPFFQAGINRGPVTVGTVRAHDVRSMDRDTWMARIAEAFPRAICKALGFEDDPDEKTDTLVNQSLINTGGELGHSDKHGLQNQALSRLASDSWPHMQRCWFVLAWHSATSSNQECHCFTEGNLWRKAGTSCDGGVRLRAGGFVPVLAAGSSAGSEMIFVFHDCLAVAQHDITCENTQGATF